MGQGACGGCGQDDDRFDFDHFADDAPQQPQQMYTSACSRSTLNVCQMEISHLDFDPTHPSVRARLLRLLNVGFSSTIRALDGSRGGQNNGIWSITDSSLGPEDDAQELILKLVKPEAGEGEKLLKLASKYPDIIEDRSLAFPFRIVNCVGTSQSTLYQLIVMRKVPGVPFQDYIGQKWWSRSPRDHDDLFRVTMKLGQKLAQFHERYDGAQHGDFSASNIFYDEASDMISFIDLADIGPQDILKNDADHFIKCMEIVSAAYGAAFKDQTQRYFSSGYTSAPNGLNIRSCKTRSLRTAGRCR